MDQINSQWIKCLLHRVDLDNEYTLIDLTVLPRKGERFVMEDAHGDNEEFIVTEVLHRFTALKKQLVEVHIQPLSNPEDSTIDSSTFPKIRSDFTNKPTYDKQDVSSHDSSSSKEPETIPVDNTPVDHSSKSKFHENHDHSHDSSSSNHTWNASSKNDSYSSRDPDSSDRSSDRGSYSSDNNNDNY